ncbi:MAG: hypothetical protein EBU90_09605 [Proteobacteria bacterium]|nr:hypothetical protein [Pseudomonadota bacterium]
MNVIIVFLTIQVILLLFMTFHDWVHLPPLTDIHELKKHTSKRGRFINSTIFFFLIAIPLWLTWYYQPHFPLLVLILLVNFYGWLTLGTIFSWWVPYFFGSSEKHKSDFVEYQNTHHFLPAHGNNVVPNTLHVMLHLQIWTCFAISVYLLIN